MDETRLRRLLDVGRSLLSELDPDAVLDRLLAVAQELTAARYAAIGVLDERRERLERFITKGIDEETHRWARELHDETLQELAGLKVLLSGARRSDDRTRLDGAADEAIEMLGRAIANLRALITDLRPASLDELGTQPAVEALIDRVRAQSGLEITAAIQLAGEAQRPSRRHAREHEVAVYRLVQEGLTNVVKHAGARTVSVTIDDAVDGDGRHIVVVIRDDGRGFDPDDDAPGFGLLGLRERIALVDGLLDVRSAPGAGTTLRARIPVAHDSQGRQPVNTGG